MSHSRGRYSSLVNASAKGAAYSYRRLAIGKTDMHEGFNTAR
ncbi:hypothetical protein PT7_0284 [Pusillimonas sp. T7-7]|nr:hypothetical protein PT7_0284 [Pusillimonas sp. T7-7]